MDIKEIALKVAMDTGLYLDGANQSEPFYVVKPEEIVEFAEALIAELAKQNEPVYFEWRHCDTSNDPNGIWSEWKKVEPRNAYVNTVEDSVAEFDAYIAQGYRYELRKLYTSDQVAAAVLKAIKPLEDQLTKAEQRVAEACKSMCLRLVRKENEHAARYGFGYLNYSAQDVADFIGNGEWRKFVNEA